MHPRGLLKQIVVVRDRRGSLAVVAVHEVVHERVRVQRGVPQLLGVHPAAHQFPLAAWALVSALQHDAGAVVFYEVANVVCYRVHVGHRGAVVAEVHDVIPDMDAVVNLRPAFQSRLEYLALPRGSKGPGPHAAVSAQADRHIVPGPDGLRRQVGFKIRQRGDRHIGALFFNALRNRVHEMQQAAGVRTLGLVDRQAFLAHTGAAAVILGDADDHALGPVFQNRQRGLRGNPDRVLIGVADLPRGARPVGVLHEHLRVILEVLARRHQFIVGVHEPRVLHVSAPFLGNRGRRGIGAVAKGPLAVEGIMVEGVADGELRDENPRNRAHLERRPVEDTRGRLRVPPAPQILFEEGEDRIDRPASRSSAEKELGGVHGKTVALLLQVPPSERGNPGAPACVAHADLVVLGRVAVLNHRILRAGHRVEPMGEFLGGLQFRAGLLLRDHDDIVRLPVFRESQFRPRFAPGLERIAPVLVTGKVRPRRGCQYQHQKSDHQCGVGKTHQIATCFPGVVLPICCARCQPHSPPRIRRPSRSTQLSAPHAVRNLCLVSYRFPAYRLHPFEGPLGIPANVHFGRSRYRTLVERGCDHEVGVHRAQSS